jgi:tetratricopeptide (TPR) repeat protein
MNIRLVIGCLFVLVSCPLVPGQQNNVSDVSGREAVLQRVAAAEASVQRGESIHANALVLGKSYAQLGLLYEDAGLWNRAEETLQRAVSLLRQASDPGDDLAAAIDKLGSLHVSMGKLGDSEKEELEALRLREKAGDKLRIAGSWNDLAALYLAEKKYAKAKDFASRATAEFLTNSKSIAFDRVASRYTLSVALCYVKECLSALPLLKDAVLEAKATMQPTDLPVGFGTFLLGYVYWKSGDIAKASEDMERGKSIMAEHLGWQHPTYLGASRAYARFLRENSRVEDAEVVERQIRQAEATVDVKALQSQKSAMGFAGSK